MAPEEAADTPSPDPSRADLDAAIAALESVLGKIEHLTAEERQALEDDIHGLRQMADKLAGGRVDIVIFGEIDTGKSALINALVGEAMTEVSVRGGWTKKLWNVSWDGCGYVVPGLAGSRVVLIDTPGINEVDGATRAEMAHDAASNADLVIFVTDSDLNDVEQGALRTLGESGRPIIVALNKCDLYDEQQLADVLEVLRTERLPGIPGVEPDDIVLTTADPRALMYVIEGPDGKQRQEMRKPPPDVERLKVKILDVLERDGLALLALNAALFAQDKGANINAIKVRMRQQTAERIIWSYMAAKAVVVGANPVAAVDVIGGPVVDASMVLTLARLYRIDISYANAGGLVGAIVTAAGVVGVAEFATSLCVSLLKGLTLGASTLITAPVQGAAAAYGSYIVGRAAQYYFEHGQTWGEHSPRQVVRTIIESTDRQSIINRLRREVDARTH